MKRMHFILGFCLAGGLAFADRVEILMGYLIDDKGISFQVQANACTQIEDFHMEMGAEKGTVVLRLIRHNEKICETSDFEYGIMLFYSYEELSIKKGQKFVIANPMQSKYTRVKYW